ncbi:MAG: hypothetical protein HY901_20805, partial [Deltaproteobacteria bacterium]|nr:hypothetical protein [Deltaproteobacteria bacterium]
MGGHGATIGVEEPNPDIPKVTELELEPRLRWNRIVRGIGTAQLEHAGVTEEG